MSLKKCERCGNVIYDEGYLDEDSHELLCYSCFNFYDRNYETIDDLPDD